VLEAQASEIAAKYEKKHEMAMDVYLIMLEKEKSLEPEFAILEKQEQEQKDFAERMPRPLDEDVKILKS